MRTIAGRLQLSPVLDRQRRFVAVETQRQAWRDRAIPAILTTLNTVGHCSTKWGGKHLADAPRRTLKPTCERATLTSNKGTTGAMPLQHVTEG